VEEKVRFGRYWKFGEIRYGQSLASAIDAMRERERAAKNTVDELLAPAQTGRPSGSRTTDEQFKDALLAFRPRFPLKSELAEALNTSVSTIDRRANDIFGVDGRKGWQNARIWFRREIEKR
jgi:hypothetical protein